MPETFRESGDPEAAADVFEEGGGGRNGLHMTVSLEAIKTHLVGHFHLWLTSLIIRASKVVQF